MIKTKDEILAQIKERIGDSIEDNDLQFVEDISDTLTDLTERVEKGGDWKRKYEENDKAWKQKYRDRFFNNQADEDAKQHEAELLDEMEEPKKLTFEALFSEGNGDQK